MSVENNKFTYHDAEYTRSTISLLVIDHKKKLDFARYRVENGLLSDWGEEVEEQVEELKKKNSMVEEPKGKPLLGNNKKQRSDEIILDEFNQFSPREKARLYVYRYMITTGKGSIKEGIETKEAIEERRRQALVLSGR